MLRRRCTCRRAMFIATAMTLLMLASASSARDSGHPILPQEKASSYEDEHTTWVYPPWKHTWGVVRATQKHLTFFTFGRAKFNNPQGLCAVRLTATDDLGIKGDDDEVTIYGINSGENSIIYNRSMHAIGLYGYKDMGEGNLNAPWDVAATLDGLVFVTDSGNRRVVKLRNVDGELIFEGGFGMDSPAELVLPRGIAVTGGGKVLVADAGSDRVVIFDTSGVYLGTVGGFDRPVALAAVDREDVYTRPPREYFVVGDSGGARIRKCRFDGSVLHTVILPEATGIPSSRISHLDIDLYQNVAATDSANAMILKFDPELRFLSAWGETGKGRTRFTGPTGITIWRRFGQTFVAENKGTHYLWVGVDLVEEPDLQIIENGPLIQLVMSFTERVKMVMQLVDASGEVVREKTIRRTAGRHTINWRPNHRYGLFGWDGKREVPLPLPNPVPPGEYLLRLRMRATYSSRRVFEKVIEARIVLPEPEDSSGRKTSTAEG